MSDPLLADDRLTALGLLMEVHAGIAEAVECELEPFDLSGSSFEVMIRLARSSGHRLRMAELAAQSTLTTSGLSRLVDRLEAAGYVVREPCDTDGRGSFAVLSPTGLAKVTSVVPTHLATIDAVLTGVLPPGQLGPFLDALRTIRSAVRPQIDPASEVTR